MFVDNEQPALALWSQASLLRNECLEGWAKVLHNRENLWDLLRGPALHPGPAVDVDMTHHCSQGCCYRLNCASPKRYVQVLTSQYLRMWLYLEIGFLEVIKVK